MIRKSVLNWKTCCAIAAAVVIATIATLATRAVAQSAANNAGQNSDAGSSGRAVAPATTGEMIPDPKQIGGEPDGIVQVANLVYAGVKSSQCFSDHFLVTAEKESAISSSRRFHAVKLGSEELFGFPLVIMTGEGAFALTDQERANLKQFIERGGFLLASAGCSSPEWDRSLRHEMTV